MRRLTTNLVGLLTLGCAHVTSAAFPATGPTTPAAPTAPAWIGKPTAAWPAILLSNRVQTARGVGFSGSAGLTRLPNGVVVLMTAGHLLDGAKAADFKQAFKSWTAVATPGLSSGTRMTGVAMDVSQPSALDLLVLLPAGQQGPWPANVLPIRQEPLQEGDTVYLVGIPIDGKGRQAVHKGVITHVDENHDVRYTVEGTFKTTGNSGAPVVDTEGRLAAINTAHEDNQDEPGHMKLVCVSTADALRAVKLPPGMKPLVLTTQPAAAPGTPTKAAAKGGGETEAEARLKAIDAAAGQIPAMAVRDLLQDLVTHYPGTAAAKKAQQRLDALPK